MTEQTDQVFDVQDVAVLLQEHFGLPADELTPTTTVGELGLDSLGLMELTVILEERTGVDMHDRMGDLSASDTLTQVARAVGGSTVNGSQGHSPE
ncbi:acyl carrier protein [Streptomyces sp. V3I8]|uniref:acyl carrier protein n=1 Tax=Streptomyces sp. V3I8 TaxID=3042279 RepID=UPI0027815BDD|nr:acyl carrier protein [Streptomyces sp. V3I8]MDQ1034675.1 acyl carrier protein [Streptomyces sp. V3I8]